MSGEMFEGLLIAAAVAAIVYILWRNNEGVRRARRDSAESGSAGGSDAGRGGGSSA